MIRVRRSRIRLISFYFDVLNSLLNPVQYFFKHNNEYYNNITPLPTSSFFFLLHETTLLPVNNCNWGYAFALKTRQTLYFNCSRSFPLTIFIINICFRCDEEDKTIETYQDPLLDPDIVEASEPKVEGLAANQAKTGVFQMLDRLEAVTDDLLNR
jgi:hypothetical protein